MIPAGKTGTEAMPHVLRWSGRCALAAVLLLVAAPSGAATPVRQVLVLQSSDRGTIVFDRFTADFREALEERSAEPLTVTQFVIAPAGFAEPPEQPIIDYLMSVFVHRSKPDLVVTVGGPAAAFARRHRERLFPDTPFLFGAVERRFLSDVPLADNETAVATVIDYSRLLDDALRLLPQTTSVFMVMGAGPLGRFLHGELERDFERFRGRLTFSWSIDLTYAQMLERAAHLPPHAVVYYITSGTDAQGGWQSTERTISDLAAQANAPLFGIQSAWLGLGIVGGTLMFNQDHGAVAADAAVRILAGEAPATIRIPPRPIGPAAAFDARQLRRWNIPEARLPEGSEVQFRGPSLWRDYRREVLAVAGALGLQTILIVGLLYQRRARQRAEVDSRRNLELAADANRRVTMSALTASIAHDLSQPLNSIQHNAQAGEMLVASNRATLETLREILSDIRTENVRATQIIDRHRTMIRSRPLEANPTDIHAIIRESVALVGHDMRARQIAVAIDVPAAPVMIVADHVLLQQVLVNLLMNAIEAMADTPRERRRVTVSSAVGESHVEVSVRDTGTGLPAKVDGRLFEPFVTTKASGIGIGLTIARTIVEAHGGRLDAHDNPDGGATFTVTLPSA
jgi:signal transduction histidine kinase